MKTGSFNTNTSAPQANTQGFQQQTQQTTFQQAPQDQGRGAGPRGLRSQMGRYGSPMSRHASSEILNQLLTALTEEYKNTPAMKNFNWELLPLDYKTTNNIAASSILVVLQDKAHLDLGYAYHALVLEGDSAQASEKTEVWAGSTYDIQKVTGDLIDNVMLDYYGAKMTEMFPQARKLHYADAEVVPRDFNITDKAVIRQLAANAVTACFNEIITRAENFSYINLAHVGKDNTLQIRANYHQQEVADTLGFPVRADIQIDFRSVPTSQNTQSNFTDNTDRVEVYSTLSGFVVLNYDPVVDQSNPWAINMPRNANETQLYSAQFVLTQVESEEEINNATQLLALSTAVPLLDRSQPWLQQFLPSHLAPNAFGSRRAGFDPKDIGALNYEARLPSADGKIDRINTTDPQTFTEREFYGIMAALVRQGIALSLDVPEAGDSTWYNRIFVAAREIDGLAYRALVHAADALTNNSFSNFFNATSRKILTDSEDRIHLGYYIDQDNVKHDIRNIDLVWMLNRFGADDATVGRQWTDTFVNTTRPMSVNLALRRKMIEACVSNAVFTGFARRITFHADFLTSLDKAIAATGLQVRAVTSGQDARWQQRASANLAGQGALMTGFASGFAGAGMGGMAQNFGGARPMNSVQRW